MRRLLASGPRGQVAEFPLSSEHGARPPLLGGATPLARADGVILARSHWLARSVAPCLVTRLGCQAAEAGTSSQALKDSTRLLPEEGAHRADGTSDRPLGGGDVSHPTDPIWAGM